MGLCHIEPLSRALTGNSWHGRFRTVVADSNDPLLVDKYVAWQTFPCEYMVKHIPKTYATKYIANAVPPLAIANWFIRRELDRYVGHSIDTMIDLFAGIGGWALALCYYLRIRIKKIIAVDIDARALELYRLNAGKLCGIDVLPVKRDVMSLDRLPEAELITMSPPCESVSSANVHATCEPATSLAIKAITLAKTTHYALALFEEAPTRKKCRDMLTSILAEDGFKAEYVNLAGYGSLNARWRLLAYRLPS